MYGLFGSGEFLEWAGPVDRLLVESAGSPGTEPGRVLVLPTASAPEGDQTFWRWGAMGREHYRALGMAPEIVPLKTREDAERPELVAAVAGASLLFFSGGNPAYLARTLRDTTFWTAVEKEVASGCSLAGSSAGICFLGVVTFDPQAVLDGAPGVRLWVEALGYFNAVFGPHWDAMEQWMPGAQALTLSTVPEAAPSWGWTRTPPSPATASTGRSGAWGRRPSGHRARSR